MFFSSILIAPIIVGAILNLDRQVFGNFMIGRPLMAGFVIGFMTGELNYGVWMGISVELLWLAVLPLGGQLTPNAGMAVSASLIAWIGSSFAPAVGAYDETHAGLVISFITVPFWAWSFTFLDKICRRFAASQLAAARQDLADGLEPNFFGRNISGLWLTFACSLAGILVAVVVNTAILHLTASWAPVFVTLDTLLLNLTFLFTFVQFLGLLGMAVFLEAKIFPFYLGGLLASLLAISAV